MASGDHLFSAKQEARMFDPPNALWRLLSRAFPDLETGRLIIGLPNDQSIQLSGARDGPEATLTIHCWRGVWRILIGGADGFADAYIDGDLSSPDLPRLLELCVRNGAKFRKASQNLSLGLICKRIQHLLRSNTRRGSRRNIAAHYDLGNAFFGAWLDASMSYSSGLFAAGDTLERAQERKLNRIAELTAPISGTRILEIGCGWGALVARLLDGGAASVLGITLSNAQLAYARARLTKSAKADLRLADYRDVIGTFDRIVSIEMIEAVGERYWRTYFESVCARLAPAGIAVIQAITIDEARFLAYRKRPDFIQRYIFPGGMLPTKSIIERESARAGLALVHRESFGDSYAATLREWRTRFLCAWPELKLQGFDERFRRMWDYYLAYCETGFRRRALDVSLFQFRN
jgi:cyclopropane-fatty-acyl-phospholipid synthase